MNSMTRRNGVLGSEARKHWQVPALLFALVWLSCTWFGSWAFNPNSATRLLAATAIVEHGNARIDDFADMTMDKALFDGHFYMDKAPGMTLMALPWVALTNHVTNRSSFDIPHRLFDPTAENFLKLRMRVAVAFTSAILTALRRGEFDVLVGINLLREGLDLPEVSLVAVLDADKEGFLRSETSLIQTAGRAARNVNGSVIMYADQRTGSIDRAVAETHRRRERQDRYNREHGIEPKTILRDIHGPLVAMSRLDYGDKYHGQEVPDPYGGKPAGYELALDMIEDGCAGLAQLLAR